MNNPLNYNIALIPDADIITSAVAASKKLERYGGTFILDEATYYTHLSLYMTTLKPTELDHVGELLATIAAQTRTAHSVAIHYSQVDGYVDAEYVRSPQLIALQERVITAINPIREPLNDKEMRKLQRAKGVMRTNMEQFGYPRVGELFRPHVTLTRLPGMTTVEARTLPDPGAFSGQFVGIGLFARGEHGACIEKLAEWPLR
jgi:hypothetical protein